MAITSTTTGFIYDGNASTVTAYPFTATVYDVGDIYVALKATGETVFGDAISQDLYTVTLASDFSGADVVMDTAYPATTDVMIFRQLDVTQPTSYTPGDRSPQRLTREPWTGRS